MLAVSGTAAFGAASLALIRFTGSLPVLALLIAASVASWIIVPIWIGGRRLAKADL